MDSEFQNERLAIWIGGPGSVLLLLVGWWAVARLVPPPAPTRTAQQIAEMFQRDSTRITVGIVITLFGGTLMSLWAVVLSIRMRRVEGRWGVLSLTQLVLGALLPLEFIIPGTILLELSFRSLPATTALAVSDIGMIFWIQPVYTVLLEAAVLCVLVFQDKSDDPLFPHWTAWLDLGFIVGMLPILFVTLFKRGLLAWNGLFGWWVPLGSWCVWLLVTSAVLLRATSRQSSLEAEPEPSSEDWAKWRLMYGAIEQER